MINKEYILNIDSSMFELFHSELLINSKEINILLNKKEFILDNDIDTIIISFQSIEGAARIIGFKPVEKLIVILLKLLRNIENIDIQTDLFEKLSWVLLESNNILIGIGEKNREEIADEINVLIEIIDKQIDKVQEIIELSSDINDSTPKEESPATQKSASQEYSDTSMIDLFLVEVENNCRVLEDNLIEAEVNNSKEFIEPLMRAAHSIKGAARIVGLDIAVNLAHSMEEILEKAMNGEFILEVTSIDELLKSTDIFKQLINMQAEHVSLWFLDQEEEIKSICKNLDNILVGKVVITDKIKTNKAIKKKQKDVKDIGKTETKTEIIEETAYVRVLSENLNKLLGLAGESLVEARTLRPLIYPLQKIRNSYLGLESLSEELFHSIQNSIVSDDIKKTITKLVGDIENLKLSLQGYSENFEKYSRRLEFLTEKMHTEVLASRMVPFSEGLLGFKRMVRDISKTLDKKVDFEILGSNTKIDRDILEKLESPLMHIIRNALSHGIEAQEDRKKSKKDDIGSLILKAEHKAGMLHISISDDGNGIDIEKLRLAVVEKGYVSKKMAKKMIDSELIDFLFLPGFSTASEVSEISGRGVGLDVVHSMISKVSGIVHVETVKGKGTTFFLQLPLTLSVVRALLVDINGEPYAIPLSKIDHIIELNNEELLSAEDHQYFAFNNENIGLVSASQVLEIDRISEFEFPVKTIIISDRMNKFGFVVDKIFGERELVIRPLDKRLGKIQNINAVAIMENSLPVIILDVDDLVRSIDNIISGASLSQIRKSVSIAVTARKKILVVDDSLTVREVERRLLENAGYEVTVAIDGMEGWNMVQKRPFDLIISDIDMPRMNGIQFVTMVKDDTKYKDIPIIIISYKDREEDRIRGLNAGANHYLTKSSFHDKNFINTVRDLIGEA